MDIKLSEEEMRQALFGGSPHVGPATTAVTESVTRVKRSPEIKLRGERSPFSKLRVTLQVSRIFEGDLQVLTHDAKTLSTFMAEQEARSLAKKQGYSYVDLVSVEPVQ